MRQTRVTFLPGLADFGCHGDGGAPPLNGQGPRMLGYSPTSSRLVMYLNVIPGWSKCWVRGLGTAGSFSLSLGSTLQSGVHGRWGGGKGKRRMVWQRKCSHLVLSLVLEDSRRPLRVPTSPWPQSCARTKVWETAPCLSTDCVLFLSQGLRCVRQDLVGNILLE